MEETVLDITKISELESVAKMVLEQGAGAKGAGPYILSLHGDLGSGKTTFTQTLGKLLGVKEVITSPTFVIMKIYDCDQYFKTLVHIDAYRLESPKELSVLGFSEVLKMPDTIICIEWAERVAELLPQDVTNMYFELEGEKRVVKIKK